VVAVVLQGLSASVPAADTGLCSPASIGPHNDWRDAVNAYSRDNSYCVGSDNWSVQDFGGFPLAIPAGATIDGMQVVVEWSSKNKSLARLGVELSSDGGLSYTLTGLNDTRTSTEDSDSVFGGSSYTWGRTSWSSADFTDTVFRVRLEAMETKSPLQVDWVGIRVYYTIEAPAVNNDDGATAVAATSATLRGTVTAGTPTPEALVYWGPTDGGMTPGNWSNVVELGLQSGSFSTALTGLLANQTNYYRCHATNFVDGAWADYTTNFVTAAPALTLETTRVVTEETGEATLRVRLDVTSAVPVSVNYATVDDSAESGADYTAAAGTLIWAAHETGAKSIAIAITSDEDDEVDELLDVIFSGPTNAVISGVATGAVTILDDDGAPTFRFPATASSGPESQTAAVIPVVLSPAQSAVVTVDYVVLGGSAGGDGDDYTLAAGTLAFDAGATTTGIAFTVVSDAFDEPDETIVVALTGVSAGALGQETNHTYTIQDDDVGLPGIYNGGGAIHIGATGATLRGAVTNTGGENPTVYVYWGPTNGDTDKSIWSNRLDVGVLGLASFSTNVYLTVSNVLYYYRCYATNSGGDAWAPFTENFAAENPQRADLMFNPSMEGAGATTATAVNWSGWGAALSRVRSNARTGSYSAEFLATLGTTLSGSSSNILRCSWNGLLAEGGAVTHPLGGVRPGFVMQGSAYVRAANNSANSAQFGYRWRNLDEPAVWMERSVSIAGNTPLPIAISNEAPLTVAAVNQRFLAELRREAAGSDVYNGDDLTLSAILPRIHLERLPDTPISLPPVGIGEASEVQLGARCSAGGEGTVLYGAYVTDPADLTNADWNATAWFEASDPGDAFAIVSGASLISTNDVGGYQYVTIRFTPPVSGSYTSKVRIATTDPTGHYVGGGTILNTIDYEEYTLVGEGVAPAISCAPASIAFSAPRGSLPATQRFCVTNSGAGILDCTNRLAYQPGASGWLEVTPESQVLAGAGAGRTNTLAVTAAGLEPGMYDATVTINGNQTNAAPVIAVTLTVVELPDPGNVTAGASPSDPATMIEVAWEPDVAGYPVMVVRSEDAAFFTPLQGTPYAVGAVVGDDRVIYNSAAGATVTDTELLPQTTYHYRLYTQNNAYYSPGEDVSAATEAETTTSSTTSTTTTSSTSTTSTTSTTTTADGADLLAQDRAANYTTAWIGNEGWGFDGWSMASDGDASAFLADGTAGLDYIATSAKAWGTASTGGGGRDLAAYRGLTSNALSVADEKLKIAIEHGDIQEGGRCGIALRNGNDTTDADAYAANQRLQFYILGGEANYHVVDGSGTVDTGVASTPDGIRLVFKMTGADSYRLDIYQAKDGALATSLAGSLAGSGSIDSIALFNRDVANDDVFFNSLEVYGTTSTSTTTTSSTTSSTTTSSTTTSSTTTSSTTTSSTTTSSTTTSSTTTSSTTTSSSTTSTSTTSTSTTSSSTTTGGVPFHGTLFTFQ